MNSLSNTDLLTELQRRLENNQATITEQQGLLTKLIDLNKRLEKSEEMKSHFLSNIKNEINNPLASIMALSKNMISKYKNLDPEVGKSLKLINNEANSLDFQLTNIMIAAELEAGQTFPQLVNININQVIENIILSFSTAIEKKKIEIKITGDGPVHFVTDFNFIKIIVCNLLSNAIKFSKEAGSIQIAIHHDVDQLGLVISDQGFGIQNKDLHKIFDRFTQLESGTQKRFGGHGLGLSVVKELVNLLDGDIKISSDAKGTIVSLTLPSQVQDRGLSAANDDSNEIWFEQSF